MDKNFRPRVLLAGILALATLMNAGAELPATNPKTRAENEQKPTDPATRSIDPETEQIVLRLVQSHLPELNGVLKQLRTVQPREYELAIKDLARAARKLEFAQNRDQRLFEIEVELLQAEHQASLLMAKLKVRDNPSDRNQLREAAKRLQQAQIARAEYDVETLRQRLARTQQQLDAAISRLDARSQAPEEQLEKSYLGMLRKTGRDSKRTDKPAKSSNAPPASH